ncbi:MAG: BON domain-containing protein [Candidatus Binataceae bacterium]
MRAALTWSAITVVAACLMIALSVFAQEGTLSAPHFGTPVRNNNGMSGSNGNGVASPPLTAKQTISDSAITAKVEKALGHDNATKNSVIHVQTRRGIVTLSGNVNSKETADKAQELVADLTHVKGVVSRLKYPQANSRAAPSSGGT